MSDINVKFDSETVTKIKNIIEVLEKLTRFGKSLAALTPTKVDDNALETLDKVIAFVKPVLDEPWVGDLIDLVVSLVSKKPEERAAALASVKAAFGL